MLPPQTEKGGRKIKDWELFKRLLAFALLGFLALFYLGHFVAFITIGPVTVGEPNKVWCWSEIILCISLIVLATDCFLGELRKGKPKSNKGDEGGFNTEHRKN